MPKVSIVVPNYNRARILAKRIDSILGQSFQDFELILPDDWSTDESGSILSEYVGDPRVRLEFDERNSGSTFKQWNKGMRLAHGKYVWIAESDGYADERLPERLVAVVTPVVRLPLSSEEEISLRHLRKYLGGFDRYVIGPKSLPREFSDFALRPFPAQYFTGRFGYNRLLLMEKFYRAFAEYEYILIYQLDCLVFASNLEEWCRKAWDYVGAPWLTNIEDPTEGFSAVGNGGLSLRRVRSALAVLTSKQLLEDPKERGGKTGRRSKLIYELLESAPRVKRMIVAGKTFLHRCGYHNNVHWLVRQFAESKTHEDFFWAFEAPKIVTGFRIPAPHEALEFSFELAPRYCFKANSGRLPFGCHAWSKYDREFWEPFLLK